MQISERKQNQDILNKTACSDCYHDVDEHDENGNKCYALNFDGNTYSACRCTKLRFEFRIILTIQNGNQDERNKPAKFTRKSFSHK